MNKSKLPACQNHELYWIRNRSLSPSESDGDFILEKPDKEFSIEFHSPSCESRTPSRFPSFRPKDDFLSLAEKYACHEEPILLLGESGAGKGHTAYYIHKHSSRRNRPFVYRNIAELNPGLFESELFGCVKGAYTDAVGSKGLIEKAGEGTLYLDEIGELTESTQAKLLGIFEAMKYCHVGSTEELPVKCRLIFATDENLLELIQNHRFKKQLYWRLEKFVIKIPPLRERREEIGTLAESFARKFGKQLTKKALNVLQDFSWPGNIRALKNLVDRSAILCEKPIIDAEDLVF